MIHTAPAPAAARPRALDLAPVAVLLLDADGNLFPSEEPAFVASAEVVNRMLGELGVATRYTPTELRLSTTGKNFRTTAVDLALAHGVPVDPALGRADGAPPADGARPSLTAGALERWVEEERLRVTAHLATALTPDAEVLAAMARLSRRWLPAAVSSSADVRLQACFAATGLSGYFPAFRRFSAEDSLPRPTSKPDPAIYRHAGERLAIRPDQGLAIEDSVPGALSAIGAGFATIGNLAFVPDDERPTRAAELEAAGAAAIVSSWSELADLLLGTEGSSPPRSRSGATRQGASSRS